MIIVFWVIVGIVFLHYLLFPIFVLALASLRTKPIAKGKQIPFVSLVIAAYNEAAVIEEKLRNSLLLRYPKDRFEIIVVSDGSNDTTPTLVARFQSVGVVGLHDPERRGKTAALNRAIKIARGEVILFSDANSFYRTDVLEKLVPYFSDATIGAVSGRKDIVKEKTRESSRGDSLFWDFESRLKTAESRMGSIPTGDGEIFAVRKSALGTLDNDIINDDTAITLNVIQQGLRVVYEPAAISEEKASIRLKEDFRVKARMVLGGFQILRCYRKLFFPPKDFFAFQYLIHKTLRHLMPIFLLLIFGLNTVLVVESAGVFYSLTLALQLLFYASALAGLYIPFYYCYMNLAALVGLFYFVVGKQGVSIWKKAER